MELTSVNNMSDLEKTDILIVDDLPEKLLVYETILEELGQNLVVARSGQEALRLVLQREFAVILLDVNMPGMDGFETASMIRQRKKSARTPIIFLTAFADEVRASQGYATGAVDYLPTPVIPDVLRAKVRVFIELFQMRQKAAQQAEDRARRAAAEEAARRSEFLARACDALIRSLEFTTTLQTLVQVVVPDLADVSMLATIDEHGNLGVTYWAWESGKPDASPVNLATAPTCTWLQSVLPAMLRSGQFHCLHGPLESQLPVRPPELQDDWPRSTPEVHSAIILPLMARGALQGGLVLGRRQGAPAYDRSDIALAQDLAKQAGMALENTLLVQEIKAADRRKDEFLGMLAHELRNPLGPIRNAVQVLRLTGGEGPSSDQARDIIDRQVGHIARLIDDLLDATRIARGKILLRKEWCDLVRVVRSTVEDYQSLFDASDLRLYVSTPPGPIWTEGDPTRLVQIVGNLLHNAQKFTNPGGTVKVALSAQGDRGTILVEDTGIGIDSDLLGHVFDVFRQADQGLDRSRGGLGLGLALARGLVELHGGQIEAESRGRGHGTRFSIRLPIGAGPPSMPVEHHSLEAGSSARCRILVIEDNRDAAESLRSLLRLSGYDVRTAYCGRTGLEAAADFRPQIIFCDIGLPGGLSGYDVAQALRGDPELSCTYLIALSGYGREEDQKRAREAGFHLHLTKPVDIANLRRVLAMHADVTGELSYSAKS